MDASTETRFWQRIEKSDDCWLWTVASSDGRPYLSVKGRTRRAHRISWEIHFGFIPAGMEVCHHCDIPMCVRPDHLFLGTHADNMADMARKGRGVGGWRVLRGENRPQAKLTQAEVGEIRSIKGWAAAAVAELYGIKDTTVGDICRGETWTEGTYVAPAVNRNNRSGYKGVSFSKQAGKWRATINLSGRQRHLGFFAAAEDAGHAYEAAAENFRCA